MLADEDNVDIVGHDNNTSITFTLPDNKHYNSVILHINTSMEIYTISFGGISKLRVFCNTETFYYYGVAIKIFTCILTGTYDITETNLSIIQSNYSFDNY